MPKVQMSGVGYMQPSIWDSWSRLMEAWMNDDWDTIEELYARKQQYEAMLQEGE